MDINRIFRISRTIFRDLYKSGLWRIGVIDKPIHEVRSRDIPNAGWIEPENVYSENLPGGWKAHENNPIKNDIASARSAGTPFVHEGTLYRPTQDCSKEYGKRITVNKVIELDSGKKPCIILKVAKTNITGMAYIP